MSAADKKILIEFAAAPTTATWAELNLLMDFDLRREFSKDVFGTEQFARIVDVSGAVTLPLDQTQNNYYIKVEDGETVDITWDQIYGAGGVLRLEQGPTGTINLPGFNNGNTLTLSGVAGKYDVVTFGINGTILHLSAPPIKPNVAY